jgi:hypothetical protein
MPKRKLWPNINYAKSLNHVKIINCGQTLIMPSLKSKPKHKLYQKGKILPTHKNNAPV